MDDIKVRTEFIQVLENNKKLIYKISHLYCDNNIDKKDLFQDIILNLWKSYPSFQNKSKISTWIYKVSINTAITWFRDHKQNTENIDYSSLIPNLSNEDEIAAKEIYEQLYHAINTLNKSDKSLILLLLDDYSYEEIAEIIGISKTNVSTKINRIKVKLRSYVSTKI